MLFAARGTDYLAGDADPSIFQHYWSLAVEEQFYLIWPGLLAVVSLKRKDSSPHRAERCAHHRCVVFASLLLTSPMPTWSYFGLHTRAFELGIGALLAVMWPSIEGGHRLVEQFSAGSASSESLFRFHSLHLSLSSRLGRSNSCAVYRRSHQRGQLVRFGTVAILRVRLLQWIGERSYSLYLWHWPVLVLTAAALERSLAWHETAVALLAALAISALGYRCIEHPLRRSQRLTGRPRLSYGLGQVFSPPLRSPGLPPLATSPPLPPVSSPKRPRLTPRPQPRSPQRRRQFLRRQLSLWCRRPRRRPPRHFPLLLTTEMLNRSPLSLRRSETRCFPTTFDPVCMTHQTTSVLFTTPTVINSWRPRSQMDACLVMLTASSPLASSATAMPPSGLPQSTRLLLNAAGDLLHIRKVDALLDVVTWNRGADAVFNHCAPWQDSVIDSLEREQVEVVIMSQHWGLLEASTREAVPAAVWERDLPGLFTRLRDAGMEPVLFLDSPDPYGRCQRVPHHTRTTSPHANQGYYETPNEPFEPLRCRSLMTCRSASSTPTCGSASMPLPTTRPTPLAAPW